jgi:hypothetical protein
MLFNNINSEKKMEILLSAKTSYEELIYASILRIGFDPENFDSDTFDPLSEVIPNGSDGLIQTIQRSISAINIIEKEISYLG